MAVPFSRLSRRSLLAAALFPACLCASEDKGQKGQVFEAEVERYPDETTEFQVYRLTDPGCTSTLPGPYNRVISRNSAQMLYCSDRTGSPQAFRMDLKSGDSLQLSNRKNLSGASLNFSPDGRAFCYFAENTLYLGNLTNLRERTVYTVPEGWDFRSSLHLSSGTSALVVEHRGEQSRVRSINLVQGAARTVLEAPFPVSYAVPRPLHQQILYRQDGQALWLVREDGRESAQIKLPAGRIGPAHWSTDGKTLSYLHYPEDPTQLNAIREYSPETQTDKLIAKTSQFVAFSPNRDSSVFVGASRNQASPAILIMLRVTRRELTLCEHRASHAETVSPLFSPDSQRIYFESDRHGKPAIYSVHVEHLVERIEDNE
jgi:oligogalacturonide lyase